MKMAVEVSKLSTAERRKVGCVIVIDDIVFPGYNGTPTGWDNNCENPATGCTLSHVMHAEQNALDKITRSNMSSVGASVFVTTAPCMECAKRLFGAQVKEVFYCEVQRSNQDGLNFLNEVGIRTERMVMNNEYNLQSGKDT